jgi:hypothetical protein
LLWFGASDLLALKRCYATAADGTAPLRGNAKTTRHALPGRFSPHGAMSHLADGEQQQLRDLNFSSATTTQLPQNVWLYGHDVEAKFWHT